MNVTTFELSRKDKGLILRLYKEARLYKVMYVHGVTIALLMAADLRLCGTLFPTTSELSQFVLTSPTAKQRMLEPLA